MLQAGDLKGLLAIVPSPTRAGGDHFGARDTVDLAETERMVEALLADGVTGLIAVGTTGECATLSRRDYDTFVTGFLEIVRGRVPVFMGASALGGQEVADRLTLLQGLGATGVLLGLPMWQPATDRVAIDFYRDVSEYAPDLAIMVYANARAFRYDFSPEFWEAVAAAAPNVMSAKMSRPKDLRDLLLRTANRINFVPNEMTVQKLHAIAPEAITACWATAATMGPKPIVALMAALAEGDVAAAERLGERIAWANAPFAPILADPAVFGANGIQVEKTRINAAGYCNAGPIRSPYQHLDDQLRDAAQECGRRWNTINAELREQAGQPGSMAMAAGALG